MTTWSTDWATALEVANARARDTGFRYRVRLSHARTDRWLIMRRVPTQLCGGHRA
jgi:hypothetical protein